jgi:hypothetical protein
MDCFGLRPFAFVRGGPCTPCASVLTRIKCILCIDAPSRFCPFVLVHALHQCSVGGRLTLLEHQALRISVHHHRLAFAVAATEDLQRQRVKQMLLNGPL